MPSLRRDLRSLLEKTVLKARELAEQGAHEALATLGVDQPKAFEHLKPEQKQLRNQLRARGRQAGDVLDAAGRQTLAHLVGVVAYEHWHRMLFARFLAENGLLLESEHQVPVSLADVVDLARDANLDVWDLAGRYAQKMLPAVFRADDPVLALPLARETRTELEKLVSDLPREVFLADDSLGWTYQFWQAQRKDEVNASGKKIGADELSPVTQLFTEDYMVEFLLHNTLGAWWAGKLGPIVAPSEEEARTRAGLPTRDGLAVDWTYLRFVQDEKTLHWTPAAGNFAGWPRSAKAVTFLDPCMGSGHFPVFALPLLVRLRMEEESLGCAEAVTAVLRDNIFGLELDERCTQIAAFNLALAGWKLAGHQPLPSLHLACSGLAPNATEREWVALAGSDGKLQRGMEQLYQLFRKAGVLGSLIDPLADEEDLLTAAFHDLQPLLEKALVQESEDEEAHELTVTARGLTKAAEILARQFTLIATNVPYLLRRKQDEQLQLYCAQRYPSACADLATCMVQRCLQFCSNGGTATVVTPQNWLFLGTYKRFRRELLNKITWNFVGRLGPKGFQTPMWDFNIVLLSLTRQEPNKLHCLAGIDVADLESPAEKSNGLKTLDVRQVGQFDQLGNPDSRVGLDNTSEHQLLATLAQAYNGQRTGDSPRFIQSFFERSEISSGWVPFGGTVDRCREFSGNEAILLWEEGRGKLAAFQAAQAESAYASGGWKQGWQAWGKHGVRVSQMGNLPVTIHIGCHFDVNTAVIVPADARDLPAVWAYCTSEEFNSEVRKIDQALKVTNASLVKIPFDVERWRTIAREKYPEGLPKPFSSDPAQWLFHGHPAQADHPLQVAVARLLGYQWPRQTGLSLLDCPAVGPDGLEKLADEDGIVCLSAIRGERAAADRLRALLSAALGSYDEQSLIRATQSVSAELESWLRDDFFDQHCALFKNRPFIWHIWDGLSDGFHALVNYHKLAAANGAGRKMLETVTYAYLGDWIRKQQDASKRNVAGAETRSIAAQALQKELEAILAGEPPYDLFVRWKPLSEQAIGWEPDINDGVRVNIRPFLLASDIGRKGAGILRTKPGSSLHWKKDRGTEPMCSKAEFPWFWKWDEEAVDFMGGSEFDGNRWNNCHYTTAAKRAARGQAK